MFNANNTYSHIGTSIIKSFIQLLSIIFVKNFNEIKKILRLTKLKLNKIIKYQTKENY